MQYEVFWLRLQTRLVKIVAKKELDIPLDELEQRLDTVLLLLPDLGALFPYRLLALMPCSRCFVPGLYLHYHTLLCACYGPRTAHVG